MISRIGARAAPVCLCFATVVLLAPAPTAAQGESRWFPDVEPFRPLIAAPREVQVRASFVYADRPEVGYDGRNIEAEVAIGHTLGLLRLDDGSSPGQAITLGLEMGIFSRCFMEVAQRDLINSDFRIGLPASFRRGSWESRLMIRHFSAHLGDDYLVRVFADEVMGGFSQTSKDGFEGLLARRLGESGRLYVGGEYNFHTNENMSRAGFRFGGGQRWVAVLCGRLRIHELVRTVGRHPGRRDGAPGERATIPARSEGSLWIHAHGPFPGGGRDVLRSRLRA